MDNLHSPPFFLTREIDRRSAYVTILGGKLSFPGEIREFWRRDQKDVVHLRSADLSSVPGFSLIG